jgi:hypothetical protein
MFIYLYYKGLLFYLFFNNLFVYWKSATALKERKIAVLKTVRKGASEYLPRLYSLKRLIEALYRGNYRPLL